jgi:predicted dehydrogenase
MLGKYEYVFSKVLGRGLINEHTIHMIDAMEYVMGPVEMVYARTDASEEHTEYNASILMTHNDGAFTSVCGSGVSRLPGYCHITGEGGEILIEGNRTLKLRNEKGEREVLSGELGYRAELEDFRDAILREGEPHTGIDAAMSCSRLIEAIYRSAESRMPVSPVDLR